MADNKQVVEVTRFSISVPTEFYNEIEQRRRPWKCSRSRYIWLMASSGMYGHSADPMIEAEIRAAAKRTDVEEDDE